MLSQFNNAIQGRSASREEGFTLIEIVVSMLLFTILAALSISAMYYYLAGRALDTATRDVTTQIREAQEMAVTTGNTYRVDFSDSQGKVYKLQYKLSGSWVNAHSNNLPLEVTAASRDFGSDSYLECYARGACESGYVVLQSNFGRTKTVYVDGETGNVRIG